MSTPQEKIYINALNLAFGTERVRKLLVKFGSAEKSWSATPSSLAGLGIKPNVLKRIITNKKEIDPEKEWAALKNKNIEILVIGEEGYPPALKQAHSAPLCLYVLGNKEILPKPSIAVVGTRSPSSYGRAVATSLVGEISRSGMVVVSGLAQGIDTLAHITTLEAGGPTVAVLGCGVDTVFPKMNKPLGEKIIESGGAIVSEYPIGTPPLKQHFPARNRIISGLSLGVLVVESRDPGGSLITANHALDQNREVFAVPGDIRRETSEGTNKIISQGAKLVRSAADIFEELALPVQKEVKRKTIESLSDEEKEVLKVLKSEPLHVDTITKMNKLKPSRTNSLLSSLEIKGAVRDTGGKIYERIG